MHPGNGSNSVLQEGERVLLKNKIFFARNKKEKDLLKIRKKKISAENMRSFNAMLAGFYLLRVNI